MDRSRKPKPKPSPKLSLPSLQRADLKNGLGVLLVEHHGLPLVQFKLVLQTGSAADPAGKTGLAIFTANMIDEGTEYRSALQISEDLGFIGARFSLSANYDGSFASLLTLKEHLSSALEIFSDVMLRPSFPKDDFERVKRDGLTSLLQQKDQPIVVANDAFAALVYGSDHPYGRPLNGTETSVEALTVEDVKNFFDTYYRPNNATMIVVGDVQLNEVVHELEKTFGSWQKQDVPSVSVPLPSQPTSTQLFLIDKPNAAQSQVRIGHVGAKRKTADYFPLLVMNTILGGQFTSRINLNLREDKGYTYGARSDFAFRKMAGPFVASGGFRTDVTDNSVVELMRELRRIGTADVTEEELDFAKNSLIQRLPQQFETPGAIASRLADIVLYNLPDDYYSSYVQNVQEMALKDVNRVGQQYVKPNSGLVVIVGDIAKTKEGLEKVGYSSVKICNEKGEILSG
ncbi:MAG: M16 family metallopeptidase [Bacteroidota bacterium]